MLFSFRECIFQAPLVLAALYHCCVSSLFLKLKPTLSVTSHILDFDVDQNISFYPEYLQNKSIPDVLGSNKASRDISVAIDVSFLKEESTRYYPHILLMENQQKVELSRAVQRKQVLCFLSLD